jgi:predicted nucleic acid-binding protein
MASTPSFGEPPAGLAAVATPSVVLDTNAVLDWLVFRHASCQAWDSRFAQRSARWLASFEMRAELAHVLGRGVGLEWAPDLSGVWATWDRLCTITEAGSPRGAAGRVRCSDADDQKFIDLALAHGARWLVSRDRAVLKLAGRVRPMGLEILTPEAWELVFSGG